MTVIQVFCYDDGTQSLCWDDFDAAIDPANMPAGPGPSMAFRKATWDTDTRILKYTVAGDIARLYRTLTAEPGVTLPDDATVVVDGVVDTSLQIVRSDT